MSAALSNPHYTLSYVKEVMEQAKPLLEAYLTQKGIDYWPAAANFIWAFPENPDMVEQHLRQQGILVRPKQDLNGHTGLRMTLGDRAQTEQLIQSLDDIL